MNSPSLTVTSVARPHRDPAFLRIPWTVYRSSPRWVPPLLLDVKRLLDPRKNPFWRHATARFWVVRRRGRVVGRIGAVCNPPHDERWSERAGFFGFFECVDDREATRALLDTASDWLRNQGAKILRGPVSPSTNDECGVLVDGFDSDPFIMMPYTPPYYLARLEENGLEKAMDLLAFAFSPHTDFPPKVDRIATAVQERTGLRVRRLEMPDFDAELERLRLVYNRSWADNWGFLPMSQEEFVFTAATFKPVAMPEFILLAQVEDETVAAVICVPNLNPFLKRMNGRLLPFGFRHLIGWRRRVEAVRVLTMGVLPAYRGRGVDAVLYRELLRAGRARGFTHESELGWVLETNEVMVNAILRMGGRTTKRIRLYAKPL